MNISSRPIPAIDDSYPAFNQDQKAAVHKRIKPPAVKVVEKSEATFSDLIEFVLLSIILTFRLLVTHMLLTYNFA